MRDDMLAGSSEPGMSATTAAPRARDVWLWRLESPVVSADLVLRLQKYRNPDSVPLEIRDAAAAAAAEASRLISPQAMLWRGPVTAVDAGGAVTLAGAHHFRSRLLARLLTDSTAAYVVVLTLGEALEHRVDDLFNEQSALEALLLETAGWGAILSLARDVRRRLLREESPARVTHRVAPGYGDWPLDDQHALLSVFGDAPLPVRLTEFAWMLPRKSISGVFGVVAERRG
jgi:hypothetical protein